MRPRALILALLICSCDLLIEAANDATKEQEKTPPREASDPKEKKPKKEKKEKKPNPSTAGLEIFFTTPELVYPDKPAQRSLKTIEKRVVSDIDAAKKTVYAAVYEYNLASISEALLRAKQRGLEVRLALDEENMEKPEMAKWAEGMEQANIPISWEKTDSFSHSKYLVIDTKIAWMGSWNFTNNDTYRNNNNVIRFTIPQIVANYAQEFSQMDKGIFGRKKDPLTPNPSVTFKGAKIENYFSPQDNVLEKLLPKLQGAKKSILFLAFSYTEDKIGQAMIDRKQSKVKVAGVFEARNAEGLGSEFKILQDAGVDILQDGNCYTMHHKFIIIDEKIVITGSYNFTKRAEEQNDENVVVIEDAGVAALYKEEFDRVYQQAKTPTPCGK
jgi:phosphatidylserine/phosphatidylglycerophosphate/cardiolipin synthase-like enzyme